MVRTTAKIGCASLLVGMLASCTGAGGGAGEGELTGTAIVALTGVPADGTCVEVTAAGYREVTRRFDAAAGATAMFRMAGLPLGSVTFTAAAFGGPCGGVGADAVPTWISDAPFVATVAVTPPVLVTLNLVRNGNATVVVGFDDGADGGSAAGGSSGAAGSGAGGGSTAGASGQTFMKVPNVDGEATAKGFETWFDLETFALAIKTTVSAAGTGAGAGKSVWTAVATLRLQKGTPSLYADAALGTHLAEVDFATESGGALPAVVWRAALKNVLISSVATADTSSGNDLPLLTVTFDFAQIQIEFDPRNADGSAGAPVVINWDVSKNMGGGAPNPPPALQFAYRGPAPAGFEAISAFRAPSETVAGVNIGTGAGAGKASFSDASATLPIDATVLDLILEELSGVVIRTGLVEILDDASGTPTILGSYGFQNVLLDGVTLTGTDATVSWTAQKLSWRFGTEMTTSP